MFLKLRYRLGIFKQTFSIKNRCGLGKIQTHCLLRIFHEKLFFYASTEKIHDAENDSGFH